MRIAMFTNTFTPHVGGVARSVQQFSHEYRSLGHRVLIVAPEFDNMPTGERDVVRIPAIQKFNGSDFSVPVPIPGFLNTTLDEFAPEVIHSHHPFLLGDTALRVSAERGVPIVFTHHTQYERYSHYVPGDSDALKRFVIELAVGYCNLCDGVIAPSNTIRRRLLAQGVHREVVELPTGVNVQQFSRGDGQLCRVSNGIPQSAFIVGHVGRLAKEKGLQFLSECIAEFLVRHSDAYFLLVGTGDCEREIQEIFQTEGVDGRLVHLGLLDRNHLADALAAMDVFAFSSQSETQGMVLSEAMAASRPVVAVDAPGVREILRNDYNGLMIANEDRSLFVEGLEQVFHASNAQYARWVAGASETAERFSIETTAQQGIALYQRLIRDYQKRDQVHDAWADAMRRIAEEWKIWSNVADAAGNAILGSGVRIYS